ncbi:MAG: helix-turn-helix transcriptional regulator [Ktedonobacteraceae bacterium]|nr:helix-turn-helix transcriptional regulator [Ktedonobacteraceae bacterium]
MNQETEDIREDERVPNLLLRRARKELGWSQKQLAIEIHARYPGVAVTDEYVARWENGKRKPGPYYQEKLRNVLGKTAAELGFIPPELSSVPKKKQEVSIATPAQIAYVKRTLGLGDQDMANFDPSKRGAFEKLLQLAAATLLALQDVPEALERLETGNPQDINEENIECFIKLNNTCWDLSNASEASTVEGILPTYLPKIERLAQRSSRNQKVAANIATQGYILAAEVDKGNIPLMEHYCQQAVQYSQLSGDFNIQAAALKQQATIALVAKKPEQARYFYQKAIPLLRYVSPLLRSRIYMGLASAHARCGQPNEARRYIGMAENTFPSSPEADPAYLYTICGTPVLYLYQALTYMDLYDPGEAWKALEKAEGLPVPMSTHIEIINLQASAAAALGDLGSSCAYVEAGAKAAAQQGYPIWSSEAADVFQQIQNTWPKEPKVLALAGLFQK